MCFVLTANETQTISSNAQKQDFKSPAEERLIRKMAKMALNGYEIGIQRKIKPANHIQSMAEKIQDTVVTKHPLNVESVSSPDSSRENTLNRAFNKTMDNGFKYNNSITSIGDKIKDTIINNHPATVSFTNGSVPVPPPIPTTPIPIFNAHSTPVTNSYVVKNQSEDKAPLSKKLFSNFVSDNLDTSVSYDYNGINNKNINESNNLTVKHDNIINNTSQINNIFDKSTESINKTNNSFDKSNESNKSYSIFDQSGDYVNKTRNMFDKSNDSLNNIDKKFGSKVDQKSDTFSNTLSKRNMFEKRIEASDQKQEAIAKPLEKNNWNCFDQIKKSQIEKPQFMKEFKNGNGTSVHSDNTNTLKKPHLPNKLYDNTLYHFRNERSNGENEATNTTEVSKNETLGENTNIVDNKNTETEQTGSEFVVKRRQKNNENRNDGRRDSHIVARPLSTMKSEDVADGLYPVCHQCDKAITR